MCEILSPNGAKQSEYLWTQGLGEPGQLFYKYIFRIIDNHGLLFSHPLLVSSHIFKQNNRYMNQIRACENYMREPSSNTARAAIPT
jgi:hypothetical protein